MARKKFWLSQIYWEWRNFPLKDVAELVGMEDVQEGDEVLGKLSKDNRKLFAMLHRHTALLQEQEAKERADTSTKEFSPLFLEMRKKQKDMEALCWMCMLDDVGTYSPGYYILRKGWVVVRREQKLDISAAAVAAVIMPMIAGMAIYDDMRREQYVDETAFAVSPPHSERNTSFKQRRKT